MRENGDESVFAWPGVREVSQTGKAYLSGQIRKWGTEYEVSCDSVRDETI